MLLFKSWIPSLLSFFDAATLSSFDRTLSSQRPLHAHGITHAPGGPRYDPPYPPNEKPDPSVAIQCDYSAMASEGWEICNEPDNRGCWLKNTKTQEQYNIMTDYERKAPKGVTRKYVLDVSEMALAPDGVAFPNAKVFNGSYPGPWIQACWGDDIEITVRNHLWFNGTTIHWHGIRQLNTVEMDGVNGVTQCPIAPRDEFTYKFKAVQYGSSWYHSHYSLQYADGLAGPMTIYGPSSANYTYAIEPILMTDWSHRSAFEEWSWSLRVNGTRPNMSNILLNGKGRFDTVDPARPIGQTPRYTELFEKGKRYLLRLINTSVDTTFVFSIDGHKITVIGSDFVPIEPYTTDGVLVGIGQRYHVVVEANPVKSTPDGNYWIRTIPADGCNGIGPQRPDNRTGIIRYNSRNTDDPSSSQNAVSTKCADEPYQNLVPKLPWTVTPPANKDANRPYEVSLMEVAGHPYHPDRNLSRWTAHESPLWLDFANPTINHLHSIPNPSPTYLDIVTANHAPDSWVYLVITGNNNTITPPGRQFLPVAHPIHLHGHDFALLAQSNQTYPGSLDKVKLTTFNPPRRDVVLLPEAGYIVIAFKADNPGAWLVHCHIAWHASSGLAFQILENKRLVRIDAETKAEMDRTCKKWSEWWGNVDNHWNNKTAGEFQDDSGI